MNYYIYKLKFVTSVRFGVTKGNITNDNSSDFTSDQIFASIFNEYVKQTTGYTSNEVFNMIVDLLKYTNIPFSKEYLNSYDEMNKKIIDEL
ncbi:hypothetical protein [Anaerofustis butyriciformans]|uniref:hypothetical protein n=1 Tax=Anaerofustis butyriciformans TaxID=3108533 RepID=UPI003F8BB697